MMKTLISVLIFIAIACTEKKDTGTCEFTVAQRDGEYPAFGDWKVPVRDATACCDICAFDGGHRRNSCHFHLFPDASITGPSVDHDVWHLGVYCRRGINQRGN